MLSRVPYLCWMMNIVNSPFLPLLREFCSFFAVLPVSPGYPLLLPLLLSLAFGNALSQRASKDWMELFLIAPRRKGEGIA